LVDLVARLNLKTSIADPRKPVAKRPRIRADPEDTLSILRRIFLPEAFAGSLPTLEDLVK
jgi:hypothetical protein